MKIVITGASGLVGAELSRQAREKGFEVIPAVRNKQQEGLFWSPEHDECDVASLEGVDAVVHLAGESIAEGRWNAQKKARIMDSRVNGTKLIAKSLAGLSNKPKVFVSASAIGFYGNRGDEILSEESSPGSGFLVEVCQAWENAGQLAWEAGIRVVQGRIGIVLSSKGGALNKMLTPFKMGVGGVIGSGRQYMSWVAIQDLAASFLHIVENETLHGPVNLVAPNPVTNKEFTKILGTVLNRPTIFPMPGFAARLAFGEMADELLLGGARVMPTKLSSSGFEFQLPDLAKALQSQLK